MLQAQPAESRLWRNAFFILSIFVLIILPLLSHSYGQTGDEWLQMEYGRDIWNYFTNGNPQALDYSAGNLQPRSPLRRAIHRSCHVRPAFVFPPDPARRL